MGRLAPRIAALLLLLVASAVRAAEPSVVLISLDGTRPSDVRELPAFKRIARQGAFGAGLVPAFPSNTFPNHVTFATGVSPDKHGIVNNVVFDPFEKNEGGWYWYASAIRVPTVWDAAISGRVGS